MKKFFTVILLVVISGILSSIFGQWPDHFIDENLDGAFEIDIDGDGDLDVAATGWFANDVVWYENPFDTINTGIELLQSIAPTGYVLSQNYPNPFNPSTNIQFSIPKTEFVTLKIFNLLGQEVTTLFSEKLKAGKYKYEWDAGSLASGVYLYRLSVGSLSGEAGDYVETRKMVLMK